MPLIPEAQLEELKRNTDLVGLVRSYGIELKAQGRNYIGKCPFHEDRTPSFVVTPIKGLWHCMGACQTGGSAIDFVMKKEGVEFRRAVEILRGSFVNRDSHATARNDVGTGRTDSRHGSVSLSASAIIKKYSEFSDSEKELIDSVLGYYRETLFRSEEAMKYLSGRGFSDVDVLRKFGVGFADGTLHEKFLPSWNAKAGREARKVLTEFGLFRKSGHEFFHGYIVFPVFDTEKKISNLYGRYCGNIELAKRHRYLPGPHRGIFNRDAFRDTTIILCESIIDALTFYTNGQTNVTCSYGVEGFTEELFFTIKDNGTKKVYIAYDNDTAGNGAALKLSEKLGVIGVECFRVKFPMGLDANEYSLKVKPADEAFRLLVPEAKQITTDEHRSTRMDMAEDVIANSGSSSPLAADLPKSDNAEKKYRDMKREVKGEEIFFYIGDREYRVRSLFKNQSVDILRINLRLLVAEEYYTETFDMMNPKTRAAFIHAASENTKVDFEVIKNDLKNVFREIEEILWDFLEGRKKPEKKGVEIPPEEYENAMNFLKSPELLAEIVLDFERCGLVGERINSLIGYLATVTRRTENPLAVIIQSSSSAGKSTLMDAILDFVPEEEREKYSALTGQSLFYMSSQSLKYKVLAISEEEGAERAKYALKILQSEKKISIATTSKDPVTSKMTTMEYTVEGPVVILITTTNVEIDEELQNRCLVLTVNEERSQTKAILEIQRELETLEGIVQKREKDHILKLHQNAQRILKPLAVVNPFAKDLKFPDTKLRMRRDQKKYLTLIRSIALLHQFQREIKTSKEKEGLEYIEVTLEDIWLSNLLSSQVFGRTLDELSPQTRKLLSLVEEMVTKECEKLKIEKSEFRFTRKDVRQYTGFSDSQLKTHMKRLEELEYLIVHSGKRGQIIEYELAYAGEGTDGDPFILGLLDEKYRKESDAFKEKWSAFFGKKSGQNDNKSGVNGEKSAPSPGQVWPKSGGSLVTKNAGNPVKTGIFSQTLDDTGKTQIRAGI